MYIFNVLDVKQFNVVDNTVFLEDLEGGHKSNSSGEFSVFAQEHHWLNNHISKS